LTGPHGSGLSEIAKSCWQAIFAETINQSAAQLGAIDLPNAADPASVTAAASALRLMTAANRIVAATQDGRDSSGNYCRRLMLTLIFDDGRTEETTVACRTRDGVWHRVND